jgi:predicted transcriptional regulator
MKNNYTKELEKLCEELQEKVNYTENYLNKFFSIKSYLVSSQKITVYLTIKMPGISKEEYTHKLCTAILTNVNEIKRWFIQYCDGEHAYIDLPTTVNTIIGIVTRKFQFENIDHIHHIHANEAFTFVDINA